MTPPSESFGRVELRLVVRVSYAVLASILQDCAAHAMQVEDWVECCIAADRDDWELKQQRVARPAPAADA